MKEIVEFSDWEKLDFRVGEIISVEDIEGADKLYKLIIDVGPEIGKRIICAGLKQYYSKQELIGKKIILFVNNKPLWVNDRQHCIMQKCSFKLKKHYTPCS